MNTITKLLAVVALLVGATVNLSCNVNDYCLNCATGDGGTGDGGGDADDGGGGDDAGDGGICVPTGVELCDGKDNDCNGMVDDGTLPEIGDQCANQMGLCAGGVKQCIGGAIKCSKVPAPEACDLMDNDCDNMTDEGDPGGGALCGTNTGECVAGANRCVNGQIVCVGAIGTVGGQTETCNNRDDDCDGNFDENLTLGPCVAGVDGPAQGNTGACVLGTRTCVGGTTVCVGAVFPSFELCDAAGVDQDCNGLPNNGYNLGTDPQNCGACGNVCNLANSFEGCRPLVPGPGSECFVIACEPNFFNNNGTHSDGCEFNCGHPFLGNEVCNGVDDDCDGLTDLADPDMIAPVGICEDLGACSTGTTLTCNGAAGWVCNYTNPNVQKDTNGNIIPETRCDGDILTAAQADNDCDGRVDEGTPNLGQGCDNGDEGDCRSSGVYVCNTANRTAAAVCNNPPPIGSSPETCDGRDNDCDGIVDNGALNGTIASGQEWVTIPGTGTQIMKYEASHPDATNTVVGGQTTHVCSRPGALPWNNVTHPQAEAACQAVGARLCTEAEWENMCARQPAAPTYPVAGPSGTIGSVTDYVFLEAEQAFANNTVGGKSWTSSPSGNYSGTGALQATTDTNTTVTAANAPTQAPRLDFRVNLTATTQYYVWVRMMASSTVLVAGPARNDSSSLWVGINSTAPGTANTTMLSVPFLSDSDALGGVCPNGANATERALLDPCPIVDQWIWVRSAAIAAPAGTTHTVSVYMREDGVKVDAIAVTREGTVVPPFDHRLWAFENNPKVAQPQVCNGDEYDTLPTVNLAAAPNGATMIGNTATFTTASAHGLLVGQTAVIAGVTVAGYNGSWTIIAVPSATTFRAVLTVSGLAASGGGTVNSGDQDTVLPAGSLASCFANGPTTTDAFDMSGNVKEWTAERAPNQNPLRGGSANNEVEGLSCDLDFTLADDSFFFPNVGFRCCK